MKKRVFWVFLIITVILCASACGGAGENREYYVLSGEVLDNGTEAGSAAAQKDWEWQDSHKPLRDRLDGAVMKGDVVYGYFSDTSGVTVVVQEAGTGIIRREAKIASASEAQAITVDEQGNIYLLGKQGEEYGFWKIDGEGRVSAMEDFVLEDMENARFVEPKGLFVSGEGYVYLWYLMALPSWEAYEDDPYRGEPGTVLCDVNRIYVKDSGMQTVYYEQVPGSGIDYGLISFSAGESGAPVILAQDLDGSIYLQELKVYREEEPERVWMDDIGMENADGDIYTTNGGFLFCQGSSLYRCIYGEKGCEKLLDLAAFGIFPDNVIYLGMAGNTVKIIDNFREGQFSEYTCLKEGESEKRQLSLGVMQLSRKLGDMVTLFNRYNDGVRVEVVEYYHEAEGFEAGLKQLKLDIVRGKAPDILDVSMVDYELLAGAGALADLYEYMEQDEECRKEMLMPGVLEAYELDGHLYGIAPAFALHSMWGNNSVIKNRCGVTVPELVQILKDSGKGLDAICGFSADEPVLTTLCTLGMDFFIDWENGTCDFEGEAFGKILEFTKEYEKVRNNYAGSSLSAGIRDGELVLSVGMISSVADYQLQSKLYNGNISYIGYPTVAGDSGTAVSFLDSQLAVNAGGKNQDAAWSFVKYYLLNGYTDGFPVLKAQFEDVMAQAMEKSYNTFEGQTYEVAKQSYMDTDIHIEVYEASQSDVNAVRQLVDRAKRKFKYHTEIMNIIEEEAASYFSGQKELQAAQELIQNRVGLYLQEGM